MSTIGEPKSKRILRCRICRQELATRDNLVAHQPGKGQHAFSPRRRNMQQHYQQMSMRATASAPPPSTTMDDKDGPKTAPGSVLPSGLRIATPQSPSPISALRIARPAYASTPDNTLAEASSPVPVATTGPEAEAEDDKLQPAFPSSTQPQQVEEAPFLSSTLCTSYFLEPFTLSWMDSELEEGKLTGKLICANEKCKAKVGHYDWKGSRCSCGCWIVPGFLIGASRVDEVLV
ncbi:hypothetical protein BT69DRAFT_578976 [Atractiella rhizophila]|nr:hypothetical protein BT69DRAFT_578976 [Atractiella rhizophila]